MKFFQENVFVHKMTKKKIKIKSQKKKKKRKKSEKGKKLKKLK